MKRTFAVVAAAFLISVGTGPAFAKKHHHHHHASATTGSSATGGKPTGAGENQPTATGGQPGGGTGKP